MTSFFSRSNDTMMIRLRDVYLNLNGDAVKITDMDVSFIADVLFYFGEIVVSFFRGLTGMGGLLRPPHYVPSAKKRKKPTSALLPQGIQRPPVDRRLTAVLTAVFF